MIKLGSPPKFHARQAREAVVKPGTQKLLESYDDEVEYFDVLTASGLMSNNAEN